MTSSTHWVDAGKEGLDYLRRCLAAGKTLSKLIQQRIADVPGIAKALVPATFRINSLHAFEVGGLLPQTGEVAFQAGSDSIAVSKPTLIHPMVQKITQNLRMDMDRICVCEEQMMMPGDPVAKTPTNRLFRYHDELYHVCLGTDSNEKVAETLRKAYSWSRMGVISSRTGIVWRKEGLTDVTRDYLEKLAAAARFVFVGAYDGESFLLWTDEARQDESQR
ncbi:MAG: hypothetical protein KIS67_02400 [Verrucomicrobiae bacterium]|nr:hypothetical protein [Verrucomicrobiae bacterium]